MSQFESKWRIAQPIPSREITQTIPGIWLMRSEDDLKRPSRARYVQYTFLIFCASMFHSYCDLPRTRWSIDAADLNRIRETPVDYPSIIDCTIWTLKIADRRPPLFTQWQYLLSTACSDAQGFVRGSPQHAKSPAEEASLHPSRCRI